MKYFNKIYLFAFIALFFSCAGYRYQEKGNPFAQYGVKSISIPMFYNHSNLANISMPITKEVHRMFTQFNDLKVYSGKKEADAVLIGIITTEDRLSMSRSGSNLRSAKNVVPRSIGDDRGDFYIPSRTDLRAKLQVIILKKPSEKEIELMKSSLGKFVVSSKVIANETIPLRFSFIREVFSGSGGQVIGTQNRSAIKNGYEELAKNAATNLRDMIIYAF